MKKTPGTSQEPDRKELARQKREAKRIERMLGGFDDLESWIKDILRQGLASLEGQQYGYWMNMASRMVDSQVKGAEKVIRQMALLPGASFDWPGKMLSKLTELHLLASAFRNLDNLPEAMAMDVKTVAGITTKKETVKAGRGVMDNWLVTGILETVEEDLKVRRTWLRGEASGNFVLILDYAHGSRDFEEFYEFGSFLKGEIVYFPGNYPLRGIFKSPSVPQTRMPLPEGLPVFQMALGQYADALVKSLWIRHFPMALDAVTPVLKGEKLHMIDKEKAIIPCVNPGLTGWKLMAFSGSKPLSVFGEWNGEKFLPLSAWNKKKIIEVNI